jgi:hypothetical protein
VGNTWLASPFVVSTTVVSVGSPPDAATFIKPPVRRANRIVPVRLQEAPGLPEELGILHTICTGPPAASMVFSLSSAKKASLRLSADQNGPRALSVPGSDRASSDSSERTQMRTGSPRRDALNATRRPSGDTTGTS